MRRLAAAMLLALAACAPDPAVQDVEKDGAGDGPVVVTRESAARADQRVLDGRRPLETPLVCLARAVYFEARGRDEQDLRAVAHVVLNRVENPRFPDTVCDVVKQGGQEAPCQFSWWCDGRSDIAEHRGEYDHAVRVARAALMGESEDPTDGAHFFHHRRVSPAWSKRAQRTVRIGPHIFYRLRSRG